MALVLGTNCGFVAVAPTTDPAGSTVSVDDKSSVTRHTSPATASVITEVGWWCDNATEEANFEVGLYAADGAVVPGEAGTLLHVSRTNAKGTDAGWKSATVNWSISPSTDYWIGIQVDDTTTTTNTDRGISGSGDGIDTRTTGGSDATLVNPFGGGNLVDPIAAFSIYAVWEAVSGPANLKTYNTNAAANIKTINTNPIANVKSINTNA